MTLYNSLIIWLNEILIKCGHTNGAFIELEQISQEPDFQNGGLFNSPNDEHISLMAGGQKHIEYKSFYYKNRFGQNEDRESNEEFFERFRNEVNNRNLDCDYPQDNRKYRSITITGGIYPAQRNENGQFADYLVPLRVEWIS